jgi:hypothetical protein
MFMLLLRVHADGSAFLCFVITFLPSHLEQKKSGISEMFGVVVASYDREHGILNKSSSSFHTKSSISQL